GRAKITYEHPAMQKFTQGTYGIMVYQEQIMQIASEMAGFTMGEADTLRRAMGKKDRELMAKQRDKFLAGCAEKGTAAAKAERVWELMEKFAGYGFNKSHAAAYALVAYQTAYFKANYPVEFMAALLTSEMGDTDKIVKSIDECRAVDLRVLESLIKAGAFDSLGLPRAHLMAGVDTALETGQRQQREKAEGQASFFDLLPTPVAAPKAEPIALVAEWDSDQRLEFEKEVLGFYISGHPLARYASMVESFGITSTSEIAAKSAGARVLLFGQVAALKETATKSGSRMAFVTLEDMVGTVEVTVFPEPFKAAAEHLRGRQPVLVRGRIDDADKGRVVLADDIRPLEAALAADG